VIARLLLSLCLALLVSAAAAQAPPPRPLSADVVDDTIEVTADFRGARIVIFGAYAERPGADLAVTIRGPDQEATVMRKRRFAGLWLNRDPVRFTAAPSFFALVTAKPIETIANRRALWADGLDPAALARLDGATPPDADPAAYRAALVRLKQARGLYQESTNLRLRPGGLFKAEVQLPANAATGPYEARIYLFRNGRVAQMERAEILIARAGLERRIYDFASQRPLLYGLATVAMALLAGWAAALAFRRS
jgi:uncharacterized protein (TIGR02186 family)